MLSSLVICFNNPVLLPPSYWILLDIFRVEILRQQDLLFMNVIPWLSLHVFVALRFADNLFTGTTIKGKKLKTFKQPRSPITHDVQPKVILMLFISPSIKLPFLHLLKDYVQVSLHVLL